MADYVTPFVPDFLKHIPNLIRADRNNESIHHKRFCLEEVMMNVVRIASACGFFYLTEKVLGANTLEAVTNNGAMAAGLFIGEYLLSPPAFLIHLGGVAIRNNLPDLFKAWTERSTTSDIGIALGCLAIGVFLLTTDMRNFCKSTENRIHYDGGVIDFVAQNYAEDWAKRILPDKKG